MCKPLGISFQLQMHNFKRKDLYKPIGLMKLMCKSESLAKYRENRCLTFLLTKLLSIFRHVQKCCS